MDDYNPKHDIFIYQYQKGVFHIHNSVQQTSPGYLHIYPYLRVIY